MKVSNTKMLLVVFASLVIVACVFLVWKLRFSTPVATSINRAVLVQLQADLQNVTPHFIDAGETNAQPLALEEQKIKEDVIALFIAGQPDSSDYFSRFLLDAVGERYILISQSSFRGSYDEILDSLTGKITPIPGEVRFYLAPDRNIALYIDYQAIYLYTLNQPSFVLIPESKLFGSETYHSGTSDFQLEPVQTHTKNSITISIFNYSQLVQNPDAQPNAMQTMNKKMRQTTLLLP